MRFHAYQGGRVPQRISDSVPFEQFRRSALYNDYYRRIRIDHAIALPIYVRDGLLVSFVLNRTRRDHRPRARAARPAAPHLAAIYRRINSVGQLTAREAEVLRWVAAGKSDAQIGAILRISARTVQSTWNIYKSSASSRTAAAMRVK